MSVVEQNVRIGGKVIIKGSPTLAVTGEGPKSIPIDTEGLDQPVP